MVLPPFNILEWLVIVSCPSDKKSFNKNVTSLTATGVRGGGIGGQGGGEWGGNSPPQPPISYLVTYELFETLMYCVPPPSTKTRGHLWVVVVVSDEEIEAWKIFLCEILLLESPSVQHLCPFLLSPVPSSPSSVCMPTMLRPGTVQVFRSRFFGLTLRLCDPVLLTLAAPPRQTTELDRPRFEPGTIREVEGEGCGDGVRGCWCCCCTRSAMRYGGVENGCGYSNDDFEDQIEDITGKEVERRGGLSG